MHNLLEKITPFHEYQEPKDSSFLIEKTIHNYQLYLLGVKHSYPFNETIQNKIYTDFKQFFQNNSKENSVLLVEGPYPIPKNIPEEKYPIYYKESSLLIKLSYQENIKLASAEPSQNEILEIIQERYSDKADIAFLIFLNILSTKKGNIDRKEVEKVLTIIQSIFPLSQNDFVEEYIQIFTQKIKQYIKIDIPSSQFVDSLSKNYDELILLQNPHQINTLINEIASFSNTVRDALIAKNVLELLKHKNVFAVYGLNHVICQKLVY